jgi:hypothetical protein
MATVSFSTAFISGVVDRLTLTNGLAERNEVTPYFTNSTSVGNTITSPFDPSTNRPHGFGGIFATSGNLLYTSNIGNGQGSYLPQVTSASILFRNSSGTTLTSYLASELTRTIDSDGYCVLSNFPPKTPVAAGTISDIYFKADSGEYRTITLTVSAPDGSGDVQFDDRALVTNQPWRLDGSIKFRVPISYTYST